jgi:predicted nucleic acid-binding protein
MSFSFIDTNIFMYAVGATHDFRKPCQDLIEAITNGQLNASINTEVLQEILYRYDAIRKTELGHDLVNTILNTFKTIWAIDATTVQMAQKLMRTYHVKPRDAIHAASMLNNGIHTIYSYDKDFDSIPKLKRLTP